MAYNMKLTHFDRQYRKIIINRENRETRQLVEELDKLISQSDLKQIREDAKLVLWYVMIARNRKAPQDIINLVARALDVRGALLADYRGHPVITTLGYQSHDLFKFFQQFVPIESWVFIQGSGINITYLGAMTRMLAGDVRDRPIFEEYADGAGELAIYIAKRYPDACRQRDVWGMLPLHYASLIADVDIVKALYDAYPRALFARDRADNNESEVAISIEAMDNDTNALYPIDFQWHWDMVVGGVDDPELTMRGALELLHQDVNDEAVDFLSTQRDWICNISSKIERGSDVGGDLMQALDNPDVSIGSWKYVFDKFSLELSSLNQNGENLLHIAVRAARPELIALLAKECGSLLSLPDNDGNCPLHRACIEWQPEIVESLLPSSANCRNNNGELPLQLLVTTSAERNRESVDYVNAVYHLLKCSPDTVSTM